MINANPNYYNVYKLSGDYYYALGDKEKAKGFYKLSLDKVYENRSDREEVLKRIAEQK